jgi:hypothetical protein
MFKIGLSASKKGRCRDADSSVLRLVRDWRRMEQGGGGGIQASAAYWLVIGLNNI